MQTTLKIQIVTIGNSQAIPIPTPIIEQLGLTEEVELIIFPDQLLIRPAHTPRYGWDEQFKAMAEAGDDQLLDDEILSLSNWDEAGWEW